MHDDVPARLVNNDHALAFYGIIKPFLSGAINHENDHDTENTTTSIHDYIAADTAIAVHAIFEKHKKIHFWDDEDAQKQAVNEIDDYLYDELKTEKGIELSINQMDELIEKILLVARHRSARA